MKKTIIVICTIFSTLYSTGQTIKWQDLPFEKVSEISAKNDTLINSISSPEMSCADNGLVYMIASSKLFYDRPDPKSKKIKEEFEKIANEYITKNSISDNGTRKERYAITRRGSQFQLRKHQTIKRYIFGQGSGVNSYISIDETPGYSEENVFCIFNNYVDYSNVDFEFDSIFPSKQDGFIIPNKKINYQDDRDNYEFVYTAKLCTDKFQFGGFGSMLPTYFNLKLTVTDIISGKTQTLLQIPHDNFTKLRCIQIGDINGDNKKDIIIQIETEVCQERLIYLSTQDSNNSPFEFVGNMIIQCDYP